MPNFVTRIQEPDTSIPPVAQLQLEPRRVRRQEARDKAKNNQKLTQEKAG
jgi:hypothetical protein